MTKYNSVFDLSFSVDHTAKDASDLTAEDFREALRKRIADLGFNDDEWRNATGEPWDTYDKEDA